MSCVSTTDVLLEMAELLHATIAYLVHHEHYVDKDGMVIDGPTAYRRSINLLNDVKSNYDRMDEVQQDVQALVRQQRKLGG